MHFEGVKLYTVGPALELNILFYLLVSEACSCKFNPFRSRNHIIVIPCYCLLKGLKVKTIYKVRQMQT